MAAPVTFAVPIAAVRDHVWLSDRDTVLATSVDAYAALGIREIVNVDDTDHPKASKVQWKAAQIQYSFYKTLEHPTTNIIKRARQVHARITHNKALGVGTLVHCAAGKNRSVSCILFHLFLEDGGGGSYDDLLAAIRAVRPQAAPMHAFRRQLQREIGSTEPAL